MSTAGRTIRALVSFLLLFVLAAGPVAADTAPGPSVSVCTDDGIGKLYVAAGWSSDGESGYAGVSRIDVTLYARATKQGKLGREIATAGVDIDPVELSGVRYFSFTLEDLGIKRWPANGAVQVAYLDHAGAPWYTLTYPRTSWWDCSAG
jgi:hypothetical protein